jgi:hypothetical protein
MRYDHEVFMCKKTPDMSYNIVKKVDGLSLPVHEGT